MQTKTIYWYQYRQYVKTHKIELRGLGITTTICGQSSRNFETVYPLLFSKAFPLLYISYFIPQLFAVKVGVKLRGRRKRSKITRFCPPPISGGYCKLWTDIIKSHSLPNMRQVLVEFRSVSFPRV